MKNQQPLTSCQWLVLSGEFLFNMCGLNHRSSMEQMIPLQLVMIRFWYDYNILLLFERACIFNMCICMSCLNLYSYLICTIGGSRHGWEGTHSWSPISFVLSLSLPLFSCSRPPFVPRKLFIQGGNTNYVIFASLLALLPRLKVRGVCLHCCLGEEEETINCSCAGTE